MPRISSKNQITLPVAALHEAGLSAGDEVLVDVLDAGELRVRRGTRDMADGFGVLTGVYPPDYLARLDEEDESR